MIDDGQTIIEATHIPEDPFKEYLGALPAFGSKREIDKWLSGLRNVKN